MCETQIEKEKKYMKNYYYKKRYLLNHFINCVEELENICPNRYIFEFYEKFLEF